MKKTPLIVTFSLMLHMNSASAQATLQGDEKLACEALLCLSTSTRPAECASSLRRYFSIRYKNFSDTLRGRMNFLNMCPMVTDTKMTTYKNSIINGSNRCDAASINQSNFVNDGDGSGHVSNIMSEYCQSYYGTQFMQSASPIYIGTPAQGGHWVDAADYDAALNAYNAAQASLTTAPAN